MDIHFPSLHPVVPLLHLLLLLLRVPLLPPRRPNHVYLSVILVLVLQGLEERLSFLLLPPPPS